MQTQAIITPVQPVTSTSRLQCFKAEASPSHQNLPTYIPCSAQKAVTFPRGTWRCHHAQRGLRQVARRAQPDKAQTSDDDDDDDLPIEKRLKGRGRTKPKKARTQVADLSPQSASQQAAKMPPADQLESSIVLVLVGLFAAIIGQGLFLALSGFLSEGLDRFAQDVVYKTFSPTVGLFLAVSAAYGLWKTKQEKK